MSHYLHDTHPDEQRRLTVLNQILNEASLRELRLERGERVLDVGCGLAQLTRDMARAAGVRALGIERSAEQLREARLQAADAGEEGLVELRQGEAGALPLRQEEWGAFDLVHTRFLLEHVPEPLAVVRQMVRAARPGGRIVLEDDTHDTMRLYPESPGFGPLWTAYMRAYDRIGCDPLIGHRLVSLLSRAGALPMRNTWIFFGCCAGDSRFPLYVDNLIGILNGAGEAILSGGLLERDAFEAGITALEAWKARPDAAMWLAMAWAEGIRPEEGR
jgi:ubiquinone/menaquinone biosynthesis C-methylase UbiE